MKRVKPKPKFRFFCVCVIFAMASFPPNYEGYTLRLKNGMLTPYNMEHPNTNATKNEGVTNVTPKNAEKDQLLFRQTQLPNSNKTSYTTINPEITSGILCCMCLIFIVAPMLTFTIIRYFQDQPFNKQCLVSKLYQEVLKFNLVLVRFLICAAVAFKFCGDNHPFMRVILAQCAAYVGESLFIVLMLYLMLIGILRLCIIRYKTLDIEFQWFGIDDVTTLKRVRVIILSTVVAIIVMMYLFVSAPPSFYYILRGIQNDDANTVPKDSLRIGAANLALLSVCGILNISGKLLLIYEDTKDAQAYTMNQDTSVHASIVSHICPILMFLTNALLFILALLSTYLVPFEFRVMGFWYLTTLFVAFQGIMLPMWMILGYSHLREYVMRRFVRTPVSGIQISQWVNLILLLVPSCTRGVRVDRIA